jgi:hypothetical protein
MRHVHGCAICKSEGPIFFRPFCLCVFLFISRFSVSCFVLYTIASFALETQQWQHQHHGHQSLDVTPRLVPPPPTQHSHSPHPKPSTTIQPSKKPTPKPTVYDPTLQRLRRRSREKNSSCPPQEPGTSTAITRGTYPGNKKPGPWDFPSAV